MHGRNMLNVTVLWRGNTYIVEVNANSTFGELGEELQKLTEVQADTLRLIVPQFSSKSSKMISPFSDEHRGLSLKGTSFFEAMRMPIRMMGVSKDEVSEVLQNANKNFRIAGFEDEENRLRQRMSHGPQASLRLPQGPYIFCEFRTLQIPGVELNPPASEALKRMHSLAADPGIVAIMSKHRWRVGIMTEMAPVGYVGVSPECILGFNKNHGEEISLRLRTDDLEGFRKYEAIKKTLLHELAHMVHSGHDVNFYALNKQNSSGWRVVQLNEEALNLDWTRSGSHTLTGVGHLRHQDQDIEVRHNMNFSQKLGGSSSDQLSSARASSVSAAFRRFIDDSSLSSKEPQFSEEPDPNDSRLNVDGEPNLLMERNIHDQEPDPDDISERHDKGEPDPDDISERHDKGEPDPDNSHGSNTSDAESYPGFNETTIIQTNVGVNEDGQLVSQQMKIIDEPDPDDLEANQNNLVDGVNAPLGQAVSHATEIANTQYPPNTNIQGTDSQENRIKLDEPDPDDALVHPMEPSEMQIIEPDTNDQEIQRIHDPVLVACNRLRRAVDMLNAEVNPGEASTVLQTLFKIVRNAIEHPNEIKYRRLRKANPIIQRNVASHKAAMEILMLIGFIEDVMFDEIGSPETFLVLKRDDPGLLWLAKTSLEACIAH